MAKNCAVIKWLGTVNDSEIWLSAHTLYEARLGVQKVLAKDTVNPGALSGLAFIDDLEAYHRDRIASFDASAAEVAARLVAEKGVNEKDPMMVAVAKVNGMILVTRNTKDMRGLGVCLLNPYNDPVDRFDPSGKRVGDNGKRRKQHFAARLTE